MCKDFYVYVLLDARELPEKPFYVGISNASRARRSFRPLEHYDKKTLDPENPYYRNRVKSNTIIKLDKLGYEPRYAIVAEGLTREEAFRLEVSLIERFGRRNMSTGILSNMTDGGDSCPEVTEESKHKNSMSHRKYPDELVVYCLDRRFIDYMTSSQIAKLPYVADYGVRKEVIQAWLEGNTHKNITKHYPTVEESNAYYCYLFHRDKQQGMTRKELIAKYELSSGTYSRLLAFQLKWARCKDFVKEMLCVGAGFQPPTEFYKLG